MKSVFDALYHNVPVVNSSNGEFQIGYSVHPADTLEDLNAVVDCLEDEHIKRKVFTVRATDEAAEGTAAPKGPKRRPKPTVPPPVQKRQRRS
jgi:hypothetical protein